jgi:hypothetical protein
MNDPEIFLYDHRGFVLRSNNRLVVLAVAKQILKGIGLLSWYTHDNGGGTHFTYDDFAWCLAKYL